MTYIGIIRKMDDLGRVTLPMEIRKLFKLQKNDYIEIMTTDQGILLRIPNVEVRRVETGGKRLYELGE